METFINNYATLAFSLKVFTTVGKALGGLRNLPITNNNQQ